MPADGMSAATRKGTSARPAGSSQIRLHRLPVRAEGGAQYHREPRQLCLPPHEPAGPRRPKSIVQRAVSPLAPGGRPAATDRGNPALFSATFQAYIPVAGASRLWR